MGGVALWPGEEGEYGKPLILSRPRGTAGMRGGCGIDPGASATQLADGTVYMSESAELKDTVQGQGSQAGKLTWTLDNKPIADWKT